MDRNNTNFPEECLSALRGFISDLKNNKEYVKDLTYYQSIAVFAVNKDIAKGILIKHIMGSGKSITVLAIIHALQSRNIVINGKKLSKIYYFAPASLEANLAKSLKEFKALTGRELNENEFTFMSKSYTLPKKISKQEYLTNDKINLEQKALGFLTTTSELDPVIIVIDEAHTFMQLISNGSEGLVSFYDIIMRSPNIRLIMLTGTLINSRPFELVPMFNMLSGITLFPENEKTFMDAFWDPINNVMINRGKFQNRIFGLVSSIDNEALSLDTDTVLGLGNTSGNTLSIHDQFPTLLETIIVELPMTEYQYRVYIGRREKEVVEERKSNTGERISSNRFGKGRSTSSTYRVRSRQACNYPPPTNIEVRITSGEYEEGDLEEALEQVEVVDNSPKFDWILNLMNKGEKGIVYSYFKGIGGNGALSKYLEQHGYTRYRKGGIKSSEPKKTFAVLNGGVDQKEYDEIFNTFNMENNDHGEVILVLLIGVREALGLDLKAVRWGVALELPWIDMIFTQFLARMRRFKSHDRLPPAERFCQGYILLMKYPDDYKNLPVLQDPKYKLTTDEVMHKIMLKNKELVEPFNKAVDEVAIECLLLQQFLPNKVCRTCTPDNKILFTSISNKLLSDPEKMLNRDIIEADPCIIKQTAEVDAEKITITIDGIKSDFYYIIGDRIRIFYQNKKDEYEELPPSSTTYKMVLDAIKKGKTK